MYHFSQHSINELRTLHPLLMEILETVLVTDDFRIDQGGRTEEEQWELYRAGRSKLHPPKGKHLIQPDGHAYAADIWPYVNGKRLVVKEKVESVEDVAAYAQFAWLLRKVWEEGIEILEAHRIVTGERWGLRLGINWDGDAEILSDQSFDDFPHVELVRIR